MSFVNSTKKKCSLTLETSPPRPVIHITRGEPNYECMAWSREKPGGNSLMCFLSQRGKGGRVHVNLLLQKIFNWIFFFFLGHAK